jgi:inorganic pyrophosphatase
MDILVFVEIPKFSCVKYEFDEKLKSIKVDRFLYGPNYFPFEYGFIVETEGEDGDPLDCVLLTSFSTFPGCYVEARPIGMLEMIDEEGVDHKILAVPKEKVDPRFSHFEDISDLPESLKNEIKDFFETYKRLEPGKWVRVKNFRSKNIAQKIIEKARKRFKAKKVKEGEKVGEEAE